MKSIRLLLTLVRLRLVIGFLNPDELKMSEQKLSYRASYGQKAVIPCGLDKVFLDGPDSFVAWIKDGHTIYTFPDLSLIRFGESMFKTSTLNKVRNECFGPNCPDKTALIVKNIHYDDAGIYECRVHLQASPDNIYTINITVVDVPGQPKIYDETGGEVSGPMPPLRTGANLTLSCNVQRYNRLIALANPFHQEPTGGYIWWERNGEVVNSSSVRPGVLTQEIRLTNITRAEHNARYVCLSQNADVTEPLSATVIVKMILPVELKINANLNFEADVPHVVDCIIEECESIPKVLWYLGVKKLSDKLHKEIRRGQTTISSLTFTPAMKDNGQYLKCTINNHWVENEIKLNMIRINVGRRPKCIIKAQKSFGVVDGEMERAFCDVEADPLPLYYIWYFNPSGPYFNTTPIQNIWPPYEMKDLKSNIEFASFGWTHNKTITSEYLYCKAVNSIGTQEEPCVFSMIQGGPPESPNCKFKAQIRDGVVINCSQIWNGGRPATIYVEVRNAKDQVIERLTKNNEDNFEMELKELKSRYFKVVVYAISQRGRSELAIVKMPKLNFPEDLYDENQIKWWAFAIVLLIVTLMIMIATYAFNSFVTRFAVGEGPIIGINNNVYRGEPEPPVMSREESFVNIVGRPGSPSVAVSYVRAQSPTQEQDVEIPRLTYFV